MELTNAGFRMVKDTHPGFSIDCVIFSFDNDKLKVLLNKFKQNNKWMLPGGFMRNDEDVDDAAYRILNQRTGLNDLYLKQFYLFGKKDRTDFEENRALLESHGTITEKEAEFMITRFVSVGYLSFVKNNMIKIENMSQADESLWFDIDTIPSLYSDHNQIIDKAIDTVRQSIGRMPIGAELLPEKFTITELRKIYEGFLDKELDRRNFQKKMLQTGVIKKLDERKVVNTYPHPVLFSFNKENIKDEIMF